MKKVVFAIVFLILSLMALFQVVADEAIETNVRAKKEKKNSDLYKSQLSFYLMPGYSQLGYKATNGTNSVGSFSFGGGIGYTFWFNKYVGLGTGLQLNYYTGKIQLNPLVGELNGIDNSDNAQNRYTLMQTIKGTEQQRATYLEIPLLLNFAIPINPKLDFIINIGGSAGFNIFESTKMVNGSYDRIISFPDINIDITSSESLHLGSFTKFSTSPKQFSSNFSLIGDVGLKFKFTQRTHLSFLLTGAYGLGSVKAQDQPFVAIDRYRGIASTNAVGNINTAFIGGKIALNVGLGKTKKKPETQSESEYDFPLNYTVPVIEPLVQPFKDTVVSPKTVEVKPKPTVVDVRNQKITELKVLLKELERIIATKKPKFGDGSKHLTFEVQNILTQASDIINSTKTPITIVCQSCKQTTPKANKSVGGRKAQLVKKSFLDFSAENVYVRIRVVKCKTPKNEGKISFLVVEEGKLKSVKSQKSTPKIKSLDSNKGVRKRSQTQRKPLEQNSVKEKKKGQRTTQSQKVSPSAKKAGNKVQRNPKQTKNINQNPVKSKGKSTQEIRKRRVPPKNNVKRKSNSSKSTTTIKFSDLQ